MTQAVVQARATTYGIGAALPCETCTARAVGVCSAVARPNLPRLAALSKIAKVSRGQTFLHEGAPAEQFCILILGSARLYKLLPDGRRQIIGFAYAGSFLGLTGSESYAYSAEALEPIRMCRISQPGLQAALCDFGAMERRLLEVAVNDLTQAQEQMLLLGRKTATERLASFVFLQTMRPQPRGVRWPRIHLPMSRSDIADYLGLTGETISRSLAELKKRGVITVPNVHEVAVLDHSRLEALAQGSLLRASDSREREERIRRPEHGAPAVRLASTCQKLPDLSRLGASPRQTDGGRFCHPGATMAN